MTRDNLRDAIDRMSEKAVDRFLQREDILTEKPKEDRRAAEAQNTISVGRCSSGASRPDPGKGRC